MKTLITFLTLAMPAMIFAQQGTLDLFVGTYTQSGNSKGIYVYAYDVATGKTKLKGEVATENPSFLAVSADGKHVYATNENGDGKGAVSAFAYDASTGKFAFLNQQLTQGDHPCHVVTDRAGTHVVVSNYSGGNVSIFPIQPDGSLGPIQQLIKHTGNGPDPNRQGAPHVHSAFFSPDEKRLYIQDLGIDKVMVYDYHPQSESNPLVPAVLPFAKSTAGGGPRHIAQSADGNRIYLVQEMSANVLVYELQGGKLGAIQEIGINEPGFNGKNGAADIHLSPDGKFLYASNRGDANTLAIYKVNSADGKLTKVGNQSVLGRGPRNFAISPDGKHLLVANQNSDEVIVFLRDTHTGLLKDTGNRIAVGAPVCLVFK